MLLFSCKALANAVAPVSPILLAFLVLMRHKGEKEQKILTRKVKIGDAFVFTQSIGQCSGPCGSNLVVFFGVGEKHKAEKSKKYLLKRSREVMLLFSHKALANAVAPASPILLSFLVLVRSTREKRAKNTYYKGKEQ